MTLHIDISKSAEDQLKRHARESGVGVEALAARLLERSLSRIADLKEVSGPIHEKFKASALTEDDLSELLEQEKHAVRREQRARRDA